MGKLIKKVKLENWKGHAFFEHTFEPGLNVISGANRCGKTSVLEAIIFALTGRCETVSNARILVRHSPSVLSKIVVDFSINGQNYRIERRLTKKRCHYSKLWMYNESTEEAEEISATFDTTTSAVEELFGKDKAILSRILYMAEGDPYRLKSKRTATILSNYIEELTGVNQLSQAQKHLNNLIDSKKDKYKEFLSESVNINDQIVAPKLLPDLRREKEKLEKEILKISQQIRSLDNKFRKDAQIISDYQRCETRLENTKKKLMQSLDVLGRGKAAVREIEEIEQNFENEIEKKRRKRDEISSDLERSRLLVEEIERSIDLLSRWLKKKDFIIADDLKCPACGRPLTIDNARRCLDEKSKELQDMRETYGNQQKQMKQREQELDDAWRRLKEFTDQKAKADQLMDAVRELEQERVLKQTAFSKAAKDSAKATEKKDQLLKKLRGLENEKGEISEKIRVMERFKPEDEDIDRQIAKVLRGEVLIRVARDTIAYYLENSKHQYVDEVFSTISKIWEQFHPTDINWKIKYDRKDILTIHTPLGQLEFDATSGSEKVLLLIITRLVLNQKLLKSRFLLLDEPLMHTDPQNSQSVVSLLTRFCGESFTDQIIMTTFNKPIVSDSFSNALVNHIILT